MLVTGMRGAGKTFWWTALQDAAVRELVYRRADRLLLKEPPDVKRGFGIRHNPDQYPDGDVLKSLLSDDLEARVMWRTIQACQIALNDHPILKRSDWKERVTYAAREPEAMARLFWNVDTLFGCKGVFLIVLSDALDRCADDWRDMYVLIRDLMQTALDMRSYRRLRVKIFLRTDQVDENRIADFPDASKVLSSSVELGCPSRELYGFLWHNHVNSSHSENFRELLGSHGWSSKDLAGKSLFRLHES